MPRRDPFSDRERVLLGALSAGGRGFHALVGVLLAVVAWGAVAYSLQLRYGLGVTALRGYVFWGVYITNFVFFIGISHAGTLISAILRVTGAEWRRPITRMAEAITVFALLVGAPMVFVDMGRPDRLLNLILHGRLQSPILWDILSITTYLTGSVLYLYLPMIPDLAILRDHLPGAASWRSRLYRVLSLGWRGTEAQRWYLERAIGIMAVLIIPIAVSVHTVVSWIFGMTMRPGWHSTIFGPYFVIGAIFSGIAAIITAMAIFRRAYHLEPYLTPVHFRNLGYLLLTLDLAYVYFTFSEYLTVGYSSMIPDRRLLEMLFTGTYAPAFWIMVVVGLFLPAVLLVVPLVPHLRRLRAIPLLQPRPLAAAAATLAIVLLARPVITQTMVLSDPIVWQAVGWSAGLVVLLLGVALLPVFHRHPVASVVTASVLVNVGMWLKRYVIVVPTLQNPLLPMQFVPTEWAHYRPTWVEWSITAGAVAGFVLIYLLFSKVFPIVSIWETRGEGAEHRALKRAVPEQGGIADAPAS